MRFAVHWWLFFLVGTTEIPFSVSQDKPILKSRDEKQQREDECLVGYYQAVGRCNDTYIDESDQKSFLECTNKKKEALLKCCQFHKLGGACLKESTPMKDEL